MRKTGRSLVFFGRLGRVKVFLSAILLIFVSLTEVPTFAYPSTQVAINFRNVPDNLEQSFRGHISQIESLISSGVRGSPSSANLECVVFASITLDGRLINLSLEESSGVEAFDRQALGAVHRITSFGRFPQLGPQVLLAEIVVTQFGVQSGFVQRTAGVSSSQQQRSQSPPQSDWIEEHEEDLLAYDNRPWKMDTPRAQPQSVRSMDTAEMSKDEICLKLRGFKSLTPYQLKFIPEDQKTNYLEKLAIWRTLTLEERFRL